MKLGKKLSAVQTSLRNKYFMRFVAVFAQTLLIAEDFAYCTRNA